MRPTTLFFAILLLIAVLVLYPLSFAKAATATYPPQVMEQCEAEGGCVLVSRKWLTERLNNAINKTAAEVGKEVTESERQKCRNYT